MKLENNCGCTNKPGEYRKRFDSMVSEAASYVSSWKDIAQYINPARGRFNENTSSLGKMQDHKLVLDGHATQAVRDSAAGLNSGITSKARPWFKLGVADEALNSMNQVKAWLETVEKRMYAILETSNLYGVFQNIYEELLTFGTGCFIMLEDFDKVVRGRNFTIGEYFLAASKKGDIDTFGRTCLLTVAQLVDNFKIENVSPEVQTLFENNMMDQQIRVRHLIEPNVNRNLMFKDAKNMAWRSIYWEQGKEDQGFLDQRGYRKFPVVAPRWLTVTTDIVYGHGPGWDALGDVKELQKTKYDKLLAQEKLHNPPVQSDGSVEGHTNLLPGGVTKTSGNVPNAGVRPTYQISPALDSFLELIQETKKSIDKYFYRDLFTMLINTDRRQVTAEEIIRKDQERSMLMGPILNNLDEEMLSKVIEILFDIMVDNGMIPEAPEEIEGQELKVRYISILAQAQRQIGAGAIDRVVGFIGQAVGIAPEIVDVINWDEAVRERADMEGIPVKLLNEPEVIEAIREQKAQQAAQQNALMGGQAAADTAKTMSETEMGKDSALDRVMAGVPSG